MQQHQAARQNYLQAEVHTATPQKLQLMLVEAAIKNIHRTKLAWKDQRFDEGIEALVRAQDIVAEVLCSLDVKSNEEIAKKLASIYLFIFRCLAEGGMSHNEQKLDDALRVLNAERETWKLVCEKFGSTVDPAPAESGTPTGTSDSYTPSAPSRPVVAGPAGAKVLVPPVSGGPTTFARPASAQGMRPLGASPIQTNNALATPKPGGATPLNLPGPAPQNGSAQNGPAKPVPPQGSAGSGTGWEA